MSYSFHLAAGGFAVLTLIWWYRGRQKLSSQTVINLPGPPSHSWLTGNIPDFQRAEDATTADFKWTKEYGSAFLIKGCFGEHILYLSDPKALQYILNTGGYSFPKSWEIRVRQRLTTGRGIISSDGSQHARHRRVMNPAFSHSALKSYYTVFLDISRRTKDAWKAIIRRQESETAVLDVLGLLSRTTLDAIGETAFGYKFNSIESVEPKTELHKAYQNLLVDANYNSSDFTLAFIRSVAYAPLWLSDLLTHLPKQDLNRLNNYMRIARAVAKDIVDKQAQAQANGKEGGKDVMSMLIKANNAEDPKRRLKENEILSQITSLMLAGHETTANTASWTLYELAKHLDVQRKLRDEVITTRAEVTARGDSQFMISDLDSMSYTNAVLKETLRYHPIVIELNRRAARDDVIPLATPQQTLSGETITAIPVRQGQALQLGLASYNRLPEVWGQDADQWRPERFLENIMTSETQTSIGVFGNLSTFSSGLRSCIAWRFALIEMQLLLVELIENFEFSPVPGVKVRRVFGGIMQTMVKGQEDKGTQLPLTVSIISRHDVKQ